MEITNQKSINTLNNLLEISNNRIEGYNYVSKETDEADLKDIFSQFAKISHECKRTLIAEIQKLGGAPAEETRITGKLYRAWTDVKAALTNKNHEEILNSCESWENVAVKNYEDVLKDNPLGSHLHALISDQYPMIKSDLDKVKSLRDALVSIRA
jgi:uncharacterized protein (TIGR02284 family)